MGPVIGNIGNLQFVLTAVLGGLLSVTGVGGITLGVIASYLQFTKSFTQPFMQVAQQFNAIIMALAGAERILSLIHIYIIVRQLMDSNLTIIWLCYSMGTDFRRLLAVKYKL